MNAYPTEVELRRRRFDFNPWYFAGEGTPEEKEDQLQYQALLKQLYGAKIASDCYISSSASITGSGGRGDFFKIGRNSFVAAGAYITGSVVMGDNCSINPYVTIRGKFRCGHGVRIGAYTCIVGFNHGFDRLDMPIYEQPQSFKGIELGDDIWVGAQVMIVDGITVGSHAILAGGAVITKNVPDYAIVGGNPAKIIRMRNKAKG